MAQGITQAVFYIAAVTRLFHVNKVNNNQAAQVTQTHLARDFISSFQVGAGGGFFNVAALDGAGRVNINRYQCLGVVDHNRAAAWQLHGAGIGRLNLVLNLEAAEQRCVIAVAFNAVLVLRHHMGHELTGLFVDVVCIKQDVANVAVEVVANGSNHKARFLVNQEGAFAAFAGAFNGRPKFDQVVQVPLQLGCAAANTGGARNDAGACRVFQLIHGFFQLGPVIAFNASADAAAARVVGHQHNVSASQRNKGRQRSAFVAALFFFDLNHQFLAFANHIVDARLADRHAWCKIIPGNFFKR